MERDPRALSEVALTIPLGCSTEVHQEHIMVHIVPGVLDDDSLEQITLLSKDILLVENIYSLLNN